MDSAIQRKNLYPVDSAISFPVKHLSIALWFIRWIALSSFKQLEPDGYACIENVKERRPSLDISPGKLIRSGQTDRYLNAYNNLSKPNYIPENQFKLTLASTTAPRIPRNVWSKKFFALASGEVSSYKFHSQGNSKRQGDDAWRGLWLKWFTGENVWVSVFQKNITLLQTPPSQFWIIIPRCNTCQYLRSTKENSN